MHQALIEAGLDDVENAGLIIGRVEGEVEESAAEFGVAGLLRPRLDLLAVLLS